MSNDRTMGNLLGLEPNYSSTSRQWRTNFSSLTPEQKKHAATAVVLELIKADVSAPTHRTGTRLDTHIAALPQYVEQILASLED